MNRLKIAFGFLCPWWVIMRQKRIIDRLQRKADHLSGILANPRMLGMEVAREQLEIGLKGPLCEYMAAVLSGLVLGRPDAENYLELNLQADGKKFVVIVTRPGGGLTPHQLRTQAEAEVARLRERLAELELEGGEVSEADAEALPSRILAMCKDRNWSLHWTARGSYLHLEASELIEALRGKRGDPTAEAADVLLVLMSITESVGIAWSDVLKQAKITCSRLETCPPYAGEERAIPLPTTTQESQP